MESKSSEAMKRSRTKNFKLLRDWRDIDEETRQKHQKLLDTVLWDNPDCHEGKTMFWQGLLPMNFEYETKMAYFYRKLSGMCVNLTAIIWAEYWKARRALRTTRHAQRWKSSIPRSENEARPRKS